MEDNLRCKDDQQKCRIWLSVLREKLEENSEEILCVDLFSQACIWYDQYDLLKNSFLFLLVPGEFTKLDFKYSVKINKRQEL